MLDFAVSPPPLLLCPHPSRLLGSCIHSLRPARPLPRPRLLILPVRTKMSAIAWVGVITDGGGSTSGAMGAARRIELTKTMAARDSGRQQNPTTQVISDGSGEEFCVEGTDQEESADESAEWSGADTEELVTEEEAETVGGLGGGVQGGASGCRSPRDGWGGGRGAGGGGETAKSNNTGDHPGVAPASPCAPW